MDNHKWAEREARALIRAGVNPLDAQRSVTWTLQHVPVGVDPATWIPTVDDLYETLDDASVHDARVAWYARTQPRFKRILDARAING